MEVWDSVISNNDDHLRKKVENSIDIIDRTLDLYAPGGVAFSFNGGKDSTVLLHLIRAALARREKTEPNGSGLPGVCTFFFHNDADFEEITNFTHESNEQYNLNMTVLHGDFKTGLETFLLETSVRAILLGTRRGDPNAPGQDTFCPSSKGWPPFMRVNPILEWTYHDVWFFLRCASLPYCSLYDRGYTSVGSVSNTHPNEALAREDGTFAPAHMLPDARLERAGRGRGAVPRTVSAKRGAEQAQRKMKERADQHRRPSPFKAPTVGIIIIGDEILSAKVDDVNMKFLCGELRAAAFFVDRAMFVRDDIKAIAAAVREFSDDYDAVITAGGLGPTPDDVACLGIAEAFGRQVGRHHELEARIRAYFGADVTDAHFKMADAPMGPEITLIDYNQADGSVSPFPLLRCRNVYVLPGVPSLVQQKWRAVKKDLMSRCDVNPAPYHSVVFRLRLADEATVANALETVTADGGDQVAVGSYPVSGQSDGCEVVLSLESKDVSLLEKARNQLVELLPPGVVASEHRDRDADHALNSPMDAPTVGPDVGDKFLQYQE